jgi:hypothetical protein
MNLDKLREVHDFAVENGATCGPQCAIFHKSVSGKTKSYQRARAYGFLLQLDRGI